MSEAAAAADRPWYQKLDAMQWKTLLASNLGWVFHGFEAYALILTVGAALRQLLDASEHVRIPTYVAVVSEPRSI